MSKDWWEGDNMFNTGFDPYAELQHLKMVVNLQEQKINQLIQHNNKLQDLMVELSQQHQGITHQYGNFHKKLNSLSIELNNLRENTIVFTNDLEGKNPNA